MSTEYDFNPGLDPSSLTSITQAQLLQMVSQIVTLANKGLIIVQPGNKSQSSGQPDVGNNNRYIGYLWIDTEIAGNPVLKLYTGTPYSNTYADWSSFAVPNDSITSLMLKSLSVTIAKMSSVGGNPGQLLSANAANGFDFVNFASFLTANTIILPSIDIRGAADGTILQKVSGKAQWSALDASVFAAASVALSQLQTIGVNQLIGANANGVAVGVGTAGSGLTAADVLNYFQPLSIPLTLLAGTGIPTTNDYLLWNGTAWVKSTRRLITADKVLVQDNAIIASTVHGFAETPTMEVVLVNKANGAGCGYTVGDTIPLKSVIAFTTVGPVLTPWANTTNYGLNAALDSATYQIQKKDASAQVNVSRALLIADWNARLTLRL